MRLDREYRQYDHEHLSCFGQRCCTSPFDIQKKGTNQLASWLLRERITFTVISSPLFCSLCESLTGNEQFSELRFVRLASESAYRSDVELYKKHFPSTCFLSRTGYRLVKLIC